MWKGCATLGLNVLDGIGRDFCSRDIAARDGMFGWDVLAGFWGRMGAGWVDWWVRRNQGDGACDGLCR